MPLGRIHLNHESKSNDGVNKICELSSASLDPASRTNPPKLVRVMMGPRRYVSCHLERILLNHENQMNKGNDENNKNMKFIRFVSWPRHH